MHIAARSQSHDTVRWMLAINEILAQQMIKPFDFEQVGGDEGWTPLHVACHAGSVEVI